jgi:hypothetical protein
MAAKLDYRWHLRKVMADRGMFATTDLIEPLARRSIGLSSSQVYRLVVIHRAAPRRATRAHRHLPRSAPTGTARRHRPGRRDRVGAQRYWSAFVSGCGRVDPGQLALGPAEQGEFVVVGVGRAAHRTRLIAACVQPCAAGGTCHDDREAALVRGVAIVLGGRHPPGDAHEDGEWDHHAGDRDPSATAGGGWGWCGGDGGPRPRCAGAQMPYLTYRCPARASTLDNELGVPGQCGQATGVPGIHLDNQVPDNRETSNVTWLNASATLRSHTATWLQ